MLIRLTLTAAALLILPHSTWAFDPFTVIAVGSAAVNTVQSVAGSSKKLDEVGSSLSALSDLASELDDGSWSGNGAERITQKLQEIERLALEAGYTKEELEDILRDGRHSNETLATTLNRITRSIRLGKRIVALAGVSTQKASEVASVDQTKNQNDEKKILTDIYGQMVNQDLEKRREEVKKQKVIRDAVTKLKDFVRGIAPGGNLYLFPVQSTLIKRAIEVFRSYSGVLLILVSVILLGRLVYFQISMAPPEKYADLIRDAFVCYFLMSAFPVVYSHIANFSEALSLKLSQILHVVGPKPPEPVKITEMLVPWYLRLDVLRSAVYVLVYGLFNLVLAVLIAIGPIVVLAGTMMNFTVSLPAYFAAIVITWLWPVIWNIVGFFGGLLWESKDWSASGIVDGLLGVLFYLFQVFSPFVLIKHLQKTSGGQAATNSVQPIRAGAQAMANSAAARAVSETIKTKALAATTGGAGLVAQGARWAAHGVAPRAAGRNREPEIQIGNARWRS